MEPDSSCCGGRWTPWVNYEQLARAILKTLADLDGSLAGNQVRFIRLHFEMTLQAFAKRFGVTHAAVSKWEKTGNKPTGMIWTTEKDIRLFVMRKLRVSPAEFLALYGKLEQRASNKSPKIELDAEKLAA
jgi:transcriptional regulator with XRE-family HTH domain